MSLVTSLTQLLDEKNDKEEFSGAILIQQDEQPVFKQAYGYANRTWTIKNQLDTRFRIASISKMFTSVAVLQLVDQGRLSLDTSVVECLELTNTKIPKEATITHMLTMTSGITDWFDESGDWEANWAALCREHPLYLFRDNKDYLPLFVNEEPVAPVGAKHQYNGAGYILLGLVIEKISERPYFDTIRQNIFKPAQMSRSDFLALDSVADEVAEGYVAVTNDKDEITGWKKNIYGTTPEAAADGGATSTVDDLCRFSHALRQGALLSEQSTSEMLTPHVLSGEPFRGYTWKYGYANMFVLDEAEQIVRWGHTGEEDGVSCRLYYYPQQNLDVLILGNQSWCAGSLGWEIHDLLIDSF